MDKQTAIDLLDNLLGMVEDNHESDYDTAIKMGIDALKEKTQLSKEDATKDATFDCISRQDAIALFCKHKNVIWTTLDVMIELKSLPSVQPEETIEEQERSIDEALRVARDIATIIENEKDMRAILNAPSVQSQRMSDDETCDSCRYRYNEWDEEPCDGCTPGDSRYCPDSIELQPPISKREWYQIGYEAGQKSAQPQRWIPVSELLPDDGVEVWVTINGHDVITCEPGETIEQAVDRISKIRWVTRGYWSDEEHAWNDPSFGCPLIVKPIAWMPINTPEPWEGEQDETRCISETS